MVSTINLTAYLLVLFAFRLSKAGYVVAGRELSIVFSTLIGSLWMKEGRQIDEAAWATLHSDTLRLFDKPKSGRIAAKVINHLGNEVMKVFRVV